MKHVVRAAMLVCVAALLLSAWSLPAASQVIASNGQAVQGHFSLNVSNRGNDATSISSKGLGEFDAVAAVSANDVWAVGDGIGTLIAHWNGTKWSLVTSPSPGTQFNNLYGVAAVSTNDVWAVGSYSDDPQRPNVETLIEHWNGAQWSVVSSPSPGNGFNSLNGVVAVSATNVWAVGSYSGGSGALQTLIEHWNGAQWSVVSSPNPGSSGNSLTSVTAVSSSNIWAVGSFNGSSSLRTNSPASSGTGTQTLVERWNGTQWSVVPSPNSSSQVNTLTGIAAVSANDIWAVGNSNNGTQTLIERWNGSSWSIVSSPNPGSSINALNAVAVVTESSVWAVGSYESGTLIERWNGTQWSVVPSPNVGTGNRLNGVAAISESSIWAVGSAAPFQTLAERWNGMQWSVVASPDQIGNGAFASVATVSASDIWAVGSDDRGPLIERWNGTQWSVVKSPAPGSSGRLNGVAVVSASDIWAVGSYYNSSNVQKTLIEHWNGTQWSVVPSPNSSSQVNTLMGVAVVSASDIWAVGYSLNGSGMQQTLIERWNGSSWSIVSSPNLGSSANSLNAAVAISASSAWAVGSSSNSSGVQQTLIERWNGAQWNVVPSPSPGSFENELDGVSAVSASNVWAVGFYNGMSSVQTLIEQWNGTKWSVIPSPNAVAGGSFLNSVAAASASNVWAVGTAGVTNGYYQTLIERWNGIKWSIVTSSNPGSLGNLLNAVAVVSTSNAWAVGLYNNMKFSSTLTEHWNGSAWSVVKSPD